MKITIVLGDFKKYNVLALPWKYAYEISKGLIQRGHDVHILTDIMNSYSIYCTDRWKIPVIGCGPFPNILSIKSGANRLSRIISSYDPDAIYYFTSPVAIVKYLKPKKPLTLHISHNIQGVYTYLRGNLASLSMTDLFKGGLLANSLTLARMFTHLTLSKLEFKLINTSTRAIKESLIRIGFDANKIKTLPLAVDELFLRYRSKKVNTQGVRETYDLDDNFVSIYFGACNPKRGILELINAVPIIKRKIPMFKLLLLLRPPVMKRYMFTIRQLIRRTKCHQDIIVIDKLLGSNDVLNLLSCADEVILPFKYLDEEPPLTLLEAMALGKAIITTKISCIKHIVGKDRGILLSYASSPLIAQAVHSLYCSESKRKSMEENSRSFARNTFVNWSDIVRVIEDELLSEASIN